MKNQAFAICGVNGSYIEFYDGRYIDTVAGYMEIDFPISEEFGLDSPYNSAIEYAHKNDFEFVSVDEWLKWSNWDNSILGIDRYVGA